MSEPMPFRQQLREVATGAWSLFRGNPLIGFWPFWIVWRVCRTREERQEDAARWIERGEA